jgi:hypothetical protein
VKAAAVQDNAKAETEADKKHKKVHIFINGVGFEVTQAKMTGAQLKALAAIPAENQIFEDAPGHHDDIQVLDDAPIHLKNNMKFYDVPVGNFGGR